MNVFDQIAKATENLSNEPIPEECFLLAQDFSNLEYSRDQWMERALLAEEELKKIKG